MVWIVRAVLVALIAAAPVSAQSGKGSSQTSKEQLERSKRWDNRTVRPKASRRGRQPVRTVRRPVYPFPSSAGAESRMSEINRSMVTQQRIQQQERQGQFEANQIRGQMQRDNLFSRPPIGSFYP